MVRKEIYLEPRQTSALERLASQSGVNEAELIRQAIDLHLQTIRRVQPNLELWDEERAFLDQLMQQPVAQTDRTWWRDDLHEQ